MSIVLVLLFLAFLGGHTATGYLSTNEELTDHGLPEIPLGTYLRSGQYVESVAENWESEFLQMFMYVVLSAFLFQKGSSESKDPDEKEEVDRAPEMSGRSGVSHVRQEILLRALTSLL